MAHQPALSRARQGAEVRGSRAPSRRSSGALGPRRRRRTENADGKGGKRTQEGGDSTKVAETVGRLAPRDLDLHLPGARGRG